MSRNFFLSFLLLSIGFPLLSQNQAEIIASEEMKARNISSIDDAINELNKNGISIKEAEEMAKSQGIDLNTFLLNNFSNNSITSTDSDFLPKSFPSEIGRLSKIEAEDKNLTKPLRFGSYFFKNSNISETPNLFLATPNDYRLGPGDNLIVNLFGALENTYTIEISREGSVKFDRIAPVYLSGLSINQAKNRLKYNLARIYSGLNSSDDLEKVDLDLSLLKARSVVVNIVGNVQVPGTYTISGFSSILNALYVAGGPNEIGTYRNIKILRHGKTIQNIDLYDYFNKGIYPSFYLRDQDVIFVEAVKKLVDVRTGFRINGLFELKENETISDLLDYNGNFISNAYKESVFVESSVGLKKIYNQIFVSDFEVTKLSDGDIVSAKIPNDYVEDKITIAGSVILPGDYSLNIIKTIADLIDSAKGFTRDALKNRAILYRNNNGINNEIISLNLENSEDLNTKLQPLDIIEIPSAFKLDSRPTIEIIGNVKNPQKFEYRENITLTDIIILSGGLLSDSDYSNVNVFKNITERNEIEKAESVTYSIDENYNTSSPIYLKPNDIIKVNKINFQKDLSFYFVEGEISNPGRKIINNSNFSSKEVFDGVELSKDASKFDSYLIRDGINSPIFKNNKNLSIIIEPNDKIVVPTKNNTVKISGEINNNIIIPYSNNISFKKAVNLAGGFKSDADKKNSYVLSYNKVSKPVRSILGIKIYPKIKPGDEIIILKKLAKEKTSATELLSITTAVTSLVALIRIISN